MPVVAGIQGVTELLAQRPGRNCHRSRKNHAGDAARQSYTNVGGTRDIRENPPTTGVADNSRLLQRSEEHTSELQSRLHLVCRLLLEKKKKKINIHTFVIRKSMRDVA